MRENVVSTRWKMVAIALMAACVAVVLSSVLGSQVAWASDDPATVTRIKGESLAVETAVESSKTAFPDGSKVAVVAREDDYKDSMSATGMAGALNAPILLTNREYLSGQTADELKRLGVEKIYLIGGTVAVSSDVEKSLKGYGTVERIFGSDACDTSVKCAEVLEKTDGGQINELEMAIVATSVDFADALSVSSAAYKYHVPIFITTETDAVDGDRILRDDAQSMIDKYATVFVPGGTGALPQTSVENRFGDKVVRVNGLTGYDTSVKVAGWMVDNGYLTMSTMGIANGTQEAKGTDALTSAPVLAKQDAPLILVEGTANTKAATAFLADNSDACDRLVVFGGTAVCSTALTIDLDKAIRGKVHYVAVLGSDYWTSSTTSFHLEGSDLMMLMRVDEETHTVSLLTIPRDTYYQVHNENYEYEMLGKSCPCGQCSNSKTWYKANYAFHYGYYRGVAAGMDHDAATAHGAEAACDAISELTGVGVTKYVLCDLVTYQSIIDMANGGAGAWINLPYTITYRFYDGSHRNTTLYGGDQYLNGFNAMIYARARTAYMSEFEQWGVNEDAERQAGNRNMLRTLITYALYPEKMGCANTGELLNLLVSSKLVMSNIPSDDIIAWGNAMQASAYGTKIYGATSPVDGSVGQFPELGYNASGDCGQYRIEYDGNYFRNVASQMCMSMPIEGFYKTCEWTVEGAIQ